MAKQLQTVSIAAPGFFGLNTQESGVNIGTEYALEATNCIIDSYGRLGSRRGWINRTSQKDSVADDNIGVNLNGIHNFVEVTGAQYFLSWNDTTFFKGKDNLITLTPTTSDTITSGNWRTATLNDRTYFFQNGYKPLYYTNETTSDEFKSVDLHTGYLGSYPSGDVILSAYGRLWVANNTTVYFSDLLDGVKWSGGSSGSLNIAGAFSKDSDRITGLGAHNGYLVIFCTDSILIYKDADGFTSGFDLGTATLVETIKGVGCVATDSIVNTGADIFFLSADGVRSLGRVIQEKSQPMRDISMNVRDKLVREMESLADINEIKAVYAPKFAFYLLLFPSRNTIYCFDTRQPLPNGSLRTTTWDDVTHESMIWDEVNNELLFANVDGIAEYAGYTDFGNNYRMIYYTNYIDFQNPAIYKILKKLAVTVIGVKGQKFVIKVAVDYETLYNSYTFTLDTGTPYYYNIDEYYRDGGNDNNPPLSEYSGGLILENTKSPISDAGNVIQVGLESEITGAALSLQKLDVFSKTGRLI